MTTPGGTQALNATTVSGTSASGNVLNAQGGVPEHGAYVNWCSDTDCYIHFSGALGPAIGAASSTVSLFLAAGVIVSWPHRKGYDDRFAVIQKTAGGTLQHWMAQP